MEIGNLLEEKKALQESIITMESTVQKAERSLNDNTSIVENAYSKGVNSVSAIQETLGKLCC